MIDDTRGPRSGPLPDHADRAFEARLVELLETPVDTERVWASVAASISETASVSPRSRWRARSLLLAVAATLLLAGTAFAGVRIVGHPGSWLGHPQPTLPAPSGGMISTLAPGTGGGTGGVAMHGGSRSAQTGSTVGDQTGGTGSGSPGSGGSDSGASVGSGDGSGSNDVGGDQGGGGDGSGDQTSGGDQTSAGGDQGSDGSGDGGSGSSSGGSDGSSDSSPASSQDPGSGDSSPAPSGD